MRRCVTVGVKYLHCCRDDTFTCARFEADDIEIKEKQAFVEEEGWTVGDEFSVDWEGKLDFCTKEEFEACEFKFDCVVC